MYTVIDHPLIVHNMSLLRHVDTNSKQFRELAFEITRCLAYEALRALPTRPIQVQTPIAVAAGAEIACPIVLVPILRAGVGMLDALLQTVPHASVGVLGLQRNEETAEPIPYYAKLPKATPDSFVLLLDPMLATGGSACDACSTLKKAGFNKIVFLNIVSCPEGLDRIEKEHPDVRVFTATVDSCLNEKKYIVPGLGDAGDRLFGTQG